MFRQSQSKRAFTTFLKLFLFCIQNLHFNLNGVIVHLFQPVSNGKTCCHR